MKIRVLPSASQDLIDGYWFYEKQSPGLGSYFKDTLFSDIDSLSFFGGLHSVHYGKYYRLLSKHFHSLFNSVPPFLWAPFIFQGRPIKYNICFLL